MKTYDYIKSQCTEIEYQLADTENTLEKAKEEKKGIDARIAYLTSDVVMLTEQLKQFNEMLDELNQVADL